jgi:hypothetical protein
MPPRMKTRVTEVHVAVSINRASSGVYLSRSVDNDAIFLAH